MKLHIGMTTRGSDFSLPLDYVTQSAAILAKRGAGKTYTTAVITEQLLECGQIPIIIDPTGAHWGLKSSADGKKPGYPVYVFGGDHADLPLEEHSGEIIARALVENPFPAVIDTSILRKGETNRFLGQFFETFYRLNRNPVHLICDECDLYAPQRPFGDEARTLGAMEDIVRRGRIKGIGCTLVSQRPAVVNKNVLTQCEMLFAMRLVHPKDIDAIKEWVAVHGDMDTAKQMIADLPALPIGTAWIWCPGWGDIFERVKIAARTTFDSSATPKPGQVVVKPKEFAAVDVKRLGEQIVATVEKAKADDPKALRAEIARLKNIVVFKPEPKEVRVEVPVLKPDQVEMIRAGLGKVGLLYIEVGKIDETMRELKDLFSKLAGDVVKVTLHPSSSASKMAVVGNAPQVQPARHILRYPHTTSSAPADASLSKAERAILTCLAQFGASETNRVAAVSGYAVSGGGFNNALGSLRSKGYITPAGTGPTAITNEGLAALGSYTPLPTGDELIAYWLRRLSKAESAILRYVCDQYPKSCTKEDVAAAAGYEATGGGFNNALGALRTLELINRGAEIRATDNLFD